jgi:hypothetical protein
MRDHAERGPRRRRPGMKTVQEFRTIWRWLSERGVCDAWGGAESRRLLQLWLDYDRPTPIRLFIKVNANLPPFGDGESTVWLPPPR